MIHKFRVGDAVWARANLDGPWLPGYVRRLGYSTITIIRSNAHPLQAYWDAGWVGSTVAFYACTCLDKIVWRKKGKDEQA